MFLPQFPGILSLPDPDMAAAIASACNEWLLEQWLQHDSRFRAMMIVAPQDPDAAAAEIDRIGDRPGIVGVHVPMLNILMGERHFYPIYEAAQRHELPIGIHPNGVDGVHQRAAAFAGGNPTYYVEWHTSISQIFQGNVTSLVAHGVFERFPRLKLLAAEGGFAWLADVMWRFDKNWAGLRDEVPWVKRPPSEYILDHVRFTTQPFIEPSRREHLEVMLDIVGAERTLLFSSDYPHWDFDDPGRLLRSLPTGLRARVAAESALELFGDRLL
jgi:predicted TIM-barrel fold metal-dependent hydrolase